MQGHEQQGEDVRKRLVRHAPALLVALVVLSLSASLAWTLLSLRSLRSDLQHVTQEEASRESLASASDVPPGAQDDGSVEIGLVMVGDVLLHEPVFDSGLAQDGSRSYDHLFAHVAGELAGQDLVLVNQETPLGGTELGLSGYPLFNGPQEVGDAEVAAGFNVILKATNHALDRGYAGVERELSYWAASHPDVMVVGEKAPRTATFLEVAPSAGEDAPTLATSQAGETGGAMRVFEKEGFRVAVLNYTYGLNGLEDSQGCVSVLDEEHVRTTMQAANEAADLVVVVPHWGEEYAELPSAEQRWWANLFVACGADLILGAHPHVLEPVSTLVSAEGGVVPCFWSLGNYVSAQAENEMLVGGMAKVTLRREADGTCGVASARLLPVVTHIGYGEDMTCYLLRDWTDELAFSALRNNYLTPAWADDWCAYVLGERYDRATHEFVL